jgi:ketosteroid isomerase-like protein
VHPIGISYEARSNPGFYFWTPLNNLWWYPAELISSLAIEVHEINWEVAMSNEDANVGVLKEAYRQWNETRGGSVDHWMNFLAPNISFGSIPRGAEPMAFATQYDNRGQLRAYFDGLLADWTMVYYRVDEYVAQGDAVFARGSTSWTNKKTGKTMETPKVDFWRFRDGKAVEFYEYFDTAAVAAAA